MKIKFFLFMVLLMPLHNFELSSNHFAPKIYSENSSPQVNWALEVLKDIQFKGNEKILDLGSGNGQITSFIATHLVPNGEACGMDLSSDMIKYAQKTYSSQMNLNFKQADAKTFTVDEHLDYVVSFSALHWVNDQIQVLKRVKTALKPGGSVFLSLSGKPWPMTPAVNKAMALKKWRPYFKNYKNTWFEYSPEDYESFLKEAGLVSTRVEHVPRMTHFENRESFIKWNLAWMPQTKRLPLEKQYEFAGDVVDAFLKTNPQKDQIRIVMRGGALVVVAEKSS